MDFAQARRNMVESQIRPNNVTDPGIVAAMEEIPRESFVPDQAAGIAYVDEALALGGGRYLMEPMVLARLLQSARVMADDVALVVGCASGYSAAVLARLAATVVAVEDEPALLRAATDTLSGLGIDNAAVVEAPLAGGYAKQAPYDVILIGGAVAEVPGVIAEQLAEGGRLVCIVAGDGGMAPEMGAGMGKAVLVSRFGGTLSRRELFDAGTPPLPGFARRPEFKF